MAKFIAFCVRTGIASGMAFIAGCDEVFRAIRISDGKEVFSVSSGAYTGASPAFDRLASQRDHVVVDDLSSRNGTFLNGTRISEPRTVKVGDRIQIGFTVFEAQ